MTPDQWKQYQSGFTPLLGRLFANLSSLESSLRIALYLIETPKAEWMPMNWKITDLQVGDSMPNNFLWSFHSLTQLIDLYNDGNGNDPARRVDPELGELRNALAHGRILSPSDYGISVLTRFSKPDKITRKVQVVARYELTLAWLDVRVGQVYDATVKINARITAESKRSA